jgi:hypothetical protein
MRRSCLVYALSMYCATLFDMLKSKLLIVLAVSMEYVPTKYFSVLSFLLSSSSLFTFTSSGYPFRHLAHHFTFDFLPSFIAPTYPPPRHALLTSGASAEESWRVEA